MDRTVGLMFVAMTVLIVGVVAISIFQARISGFNDSSERVKSQGCNYQHQKVLQGDAPADSLSPRCNNTQFKKRKALGGVFSSLNS